MKAGLALRSRKTMIYVVDDDYDVRTSLRFLLETEGFEVRTFRSGTALLGSSTRHRADCLVVDYKMADIDGLELAQRLRRLDVSTPIVMITGYPDENISAKASSAGVRQVLLKPNLEEIWSNAFETRSMRAALEPALKNGAGQLRKIP